MYPNFNLYWQKIVFPAFSGSLKICNSSSSQSFLNLKLNLKKINLISGCYSKTRFCLFIKSTLHFRQSVLRFGKKKKKSCILLLFSKNLCKIVGILLFWILWWNLMESSARMFRIWFDSEFLLLKFNLCSNSPLIYVLISFS